MNKGTIDQFRIAAIKQFLISSVMLLIQIIIFFISANLSINFRSWFYFGTVFFHYLLSTVVQYSLNPKLVIQRLKWKKEGSKLWDEILMRISNLVVLILVPVIAGLDVGRFHWSYLDDNFAVIGVVFLGASTILLNWAMITNPHFEPTVRIQKERNHKVISTGPYEIVRHPGYLAGILFIFSVPLIIGTTFTFVPVGIYVLLILLRTWLEDKTLQEELEGYSDYTEQTKYRLFPGIW